MQNQAFPVEFRSEIIRPVLDTLASGESCSLVGVGSCGKSNLARYLTRPDVCEHYLGQSARRMLGVYTDCTRLADYSMRSLHILILEAMVLAARQAGPEKAALHKTLERLWEQATASGSPDRVRHTLDEAVAHTLQNEIDQIFIVLDDLDHVVLEIPGPALNSLRALRDNYKYKLMYVTVTRRELGFLRAEKDYQDFHEIVCCNTIPIGAYTEADANNMIERVTARWKEPRRLSAAQRARLLQLSGCHAGLLGALVRVAQREELGDPASPEDVAALRARRRVSSECDKIWDSLEAGERQVLQDLASQGRSTGQELRLLVRKGLVRESPAPGAGEIRSPVFADYVQSQHAGGRLAQQEAPGSGPLWGNGPAMTDLGPVGYRLLAHLHDNANNPVSCQDLIREMLEAETGARGAGPSGPPERRLERYMSLVSDKLDPAGSRYILNDPGAYRLVVPDRE